MTVPTSVHASCDPGTQPRRTSVRKTREGSIGLLVGDDPIDGIAVAFREYHPTPRARFASKAMHRRAAMALLLVRRAR